MNEKISVAQQASQKLNMSVDKLEGMNKQIERYVLPSLLEHVIAHANKARQAKEKVSRQLEECDARIQDYEDEIQKLNEDVETVRASVQAFEKEISDAGAAMANLRENIRVRKLQNDIIAIVAEIGTYDMEEAARAKRNFQEKYSLEKEKETQMQSKVSFRAVMIYDNQLTVIQSMHISEES